jgi:hypothetical protein
VAILEPLATAFAAIFSHHLKLNIFVHSVLQNGLDSDMRKMPTSVGASELVSLRVLLQDVVLSGSRTRGR